MGRSNESDILKSDILLNVLEVQDSNLGPETGNPDSGFHDFPQTT